MNVLSCFEDDWTVAVSVNAIWTAIIAALLTLAITEPGGVLPAHMMDVGIRTFLAAGAAIISGSVVLCVRNRKIRNATTVSKILSIASIVIGLTAILLTAIHL